MKDKSCDTCKKVNDCDYPEPGGEKCLGTTDQDWDFLLWEPIEPISDGNPFNYQVGGNHYKKEGIIDIAEFMIRHKVESGEANVMKYVFRHAEKNGIEDLRKAAHYLKFIAWCKYNEEL